MKIFHDNMLLSSPLSQHVALTRSNPRPVFLGHGDMAFPKIGLVTIGVLPNHWFLAWTLTNQWRTLGLQLYSEKCKQRTVHILWDPYCSSFPKYPFQRPAYPHTWGDLPYTPKIPQMVGLWIYMIGLCHSFVFVSDKMRVISLNCRGNNISELYFDVRGLKAPVGSY